MPTIAEFLNLTLSLINLNLEFLSNLLNLTLEASRNATLQSQALNLNFSNVWGIIYGLLITSSYTANVFSQIFTIAGSNETALVNIGNAVNYLGSNISSVIGDFSGKAGLSYILNNTTYRLKTNVQDLWNLTNNLLNVTKLATQCLVELGNATNKTFY